MTSQLPSTRHLRELLAPYIGKAALVLPMTDRSGRALGNNGDVLMHAVFLHLLAEFDIRTTDDRAAAELLLVPPNGALLEIYSFPKILAERLRGMEDIPLVIFPSSAFFPSTDPSFIFAGRRSETLWILREKHSHDHLQAKWGEALAAVGVTLELDHDVVASGHRYVSQILRGDLTTDHVLIAARIDREARDITSENEICVPRKKVLQRILASAIRCVIPYGKARTLIERLARIKTRRALREAMIALLPPDPAKRLNEDGKSVVSVDISLQKFATFEEYSRLIRGASVVITNRLHVALPATILGKQVFLADSGYHKLKGVYERSLAQMGNIRLIAAVRQDARLMNGVVDSFCAKNR